MLHRSVSKEKCVKSICVSSMVHASQITRRTEAHQVHKISLVLLNIPSGEFTQLTHQYESLFAEILSFLTALFFSQVCYWKRINMLGVNVFCVIMIRLHSVTKYLNELDVESIAASLSLSLFLLLLLYINRKTHIKKYICKENSSWLIIWHSKVV